WLELLQLPYFNPAQHVVVDAMHNLFLGRIKKHFDNILGIHIRKNKEEKIRSNIVNMTTPSWTASIPHNLGSGSHGKLKADQWHLLGHIYFPASLVCLWSNFDEGDRREVGCKKIL
ncbi:hypothetical protein BDQ12DRAFT_618992, partial [Crucibulum laeve]